MSNLDLERQRQNRLAFARSVDFGTYNSVLGYYQAISCLENKRGTRLLDAPCGDGLVTAILAEHFDRVVAIDASRARLAEARKRLPQAKLHETLLEEMEFDCRF